MPIILESVNPLQPLAEPIRTDVPVGTVLTEWLVQRTPGFVEFERPTVCFLNGEPLMRKDWGRPLRHGDVLLLATQPGALPPQIWYAIISIVIGLAFALLMPKPKYDDNQGESVYTIRGQQNRVRLGDPVEVPYGRCRLWPSYGALPYNRFIGNDQWQYTLLCLGQGEYDVDLIQIEDTAITDYKEVQYQLYRPGQAVTLFDDRVMTSSEVASVEVFAPEEPEHEEWTGPYVTNEVGTTTTQLEVDIAFPFGLNHITDKGKVRNGSITLELQYVAVDSSGEPTGAWASWMTRTWTLATATPQRFTEVKTVTAGRYAVRMRRTSEKDTDNGSGSTIYWVALRAVLPSVRVYPGKTMLAIKMRATNNLNDQSAFRINVWATRKLPIWNALTGWSAPTATRSIVWALCDVMRSTYGGQLPDTYLALTELAAQDAVYAAEGRYFDFIFDQKMTVWDAARTIGRVGRAVPMVEGSLIGLIRDVPKTLPTALFNQCNMVEDSFSVTYTLPKDGDYDGVMVEYTDPSDFLPRQIRCLIGDDNTAITAPRGEEHPGDDLGENCEEIKFLGCTDRNWAYREGLYYRRSKRNLRQGVTFKTGLEGHLPRYGALIGVGHDMPRWSQGGQVLSVAGDHRTLTLSEPVVFGTGQHYVGIRLRDGTSSAPLACSAGADAYHVVLAADAPAGVLLSDTTEPPAYLFGKEATWAKSCVVSMLSPESDDTVAVEAYVYDASVFNDDTIDAPDDPDVTPPSEPTPDVPVLVCSSVSVQWAPGSNTEAIAMWMPSSGAREYELHRSVDAGVTWFSLGVTSTTSMVFPCNAGPFKLRIRSIGAGIGEWCTSEWDLSEPPDPWTDPIPPGTYIDILGGLPGGFPIVNLEYQKQGGVCTVIGFKEREFGTPTNPAVYYKTRTWSGTMHGKVWGTTQPGVQYNTDFARSGSERWIDKNGHPITGGTNIRDLHAVNTTTGVDSGGNQVSVVAPHDYLSSGYGVVLQSAMSYSYWSGFGGATETVIESKTRETCRTSGDFGDELYTVTALPGDAHEDYGDADTEDDAYARDHGGDAWTPEAWGAALIAIYTNRGGGQTFTKYKVRYRGTVGNGGPWQWWRYLVHMQKQALVDGTSDPTGEWIDMEPKVHVVQHDLDGNGVIPETEFEAERGFQVRTNGYTREAI